MKLYVVTNLTGPSWANEWFPSEKAACDALSGWAEVGMGGAVHRLAFDTNAESVCAMLNGAGLNPMNFSEIPGVREVKLVRRSS